MDKVLVLDTNRKPLQPTHPARARTLLNAGKAAVYCKDPFTIILKRAVDDPAGVTGIAIANDQTQAVVSAAELHHQGHIEKQKMDERQAFNRSYRKRKRRYRQPRINNRRRSDG